MPQLLKRALAWVGGALALIGICFVVLRVRSYGTEIHFTAVSLGMWFSIGALALAYSLTNLMLGVAWWNLLKHFGANASELWAIRTYGITQIAKYVPGNIFHMVGRQAIGMAVGLPGWSLVKSAAWELGLITFAGTIFGVLALPLVIPDISTAVSAGAFILLVVVSAELLSRFIGSTIARAFGLYVAYLSISGMLFVLLTEALLKNSANWDVHWLALAGSYVLAWLVGLLTPGAPAGLGVRELVLLFLLKNTVGEADLLFTIIIGRLVTTAGDVFFFAATGLQTKNSGAK